MHLHSLPGGKVADQELTEQVTVTPAGDTVLRVALKGDKFAIER